MMYQKKKKFYIRFTAMIIVLAVAMSSFMFKLSELQLVNASEYIAQADTSSTRTAVVKAARGEIIDRYGRPIAINREGFNLVFDAVYLPADNLNTTIKTLTNLLKKTGEEWTDNLPMTDSYPYVFTDEQDSYAVTKLLNILGLNHYATAQNCFSAMVSRYKLQGFDTKTQRTIMGVRYSMEAADYSVANSFLFAEDVSVSTCEIVEESSFYIPGVKVEASTFREYVEDDLAAHIIGAVGPLYAEDWEKVKDTGQYQLNDKIGKSGIEKAAESYLRGTDGKVKIVQAANGSIISSTVVQEAVSGNTVQLSIDKVIQRVAQDSLKRTIDQLNQTSKTGDVTGGAVVVTDVSSGEILASANYPSYSMEDYRKNYDKLVSDPMNPLFDRAFNGQYAPGSTFKPAVAIAGLQTGKITADETIRCTHRYTRFTDYQPTCLGWHGSINVAVALAKSCNFFFYELGYRIGIDDLNKYCKQLGLGVATGVELPESSGILAGPEARKYLQTINPAIQNWQAGDTIQAAIGQSDNAFTPLQLAVYCSTIANGGTRYRAHLIKSVKSYSLSQTVKDDFTEVLGTTDISEDAYNAVKAGMLRVTEDGTVTSTFSNYPIKVAGKSGTAQTYTGKDNAIFIGFAPYDNPEIAVSVVIENGQHGSTIAPVARDIFDAYFFGTGDVYSEDPVNTLLD